MSRPYECWRLHLLLETLWESWREGKMVVLADIMDEVRRRLEDTKRDTNNHANGLYDLTRC